MAFQSPFVDCRISNPKTGRIASLSLFGEDEQIPYVSEVTLNMSRDVDLDMNIKLSPPYEQALELISKDSEWLRLGNAIGIRWGYSDMEGLMSNWHYGFMTQPSVSFGEEITIDIEVKALAWHMDRMTNGKDWSSSDSPVSLLEIAELIAGTYGLSVEYSVTRESSKRLLERKRNSFVQAGRTDLQFLKYEIERCGANIVIQNQIIHIVDSNAPLPGVGRVDAIFGMYAKVDVTKSVLPLMSFSVESMGTLFLRNVYGVQSFLYGPDSDPDAEPSEQHITEDTSDENNFSSDGLYLPQDSDGNEVKGMGDVKVKSSRAINEKESVFGRFFAPILSSSEDNTFFGDQVRAVYSDEAQDHGIVARFSSIAIPGLIPGMYVGIRGVGDYFSSTYMIREQSVTINSDGATMDCEVFGRGFPGVNDDLDSMAGKASNSVEPPEGSIDELSLDPIVGLEGDIF